MIKLSKKDYQLPLPGKITILGSRVTTSAQPQFSIINNQLILTDKWVIQFVHTNSLKTAEPQLMEFPLDWEEVFPWDQELPSALSIKYHRKPQIQLLHLSTTNQHQSELNLTLETPLAIDLIEQVIKPLAPDPPTESPVPQEDPPPLKDDYQILSQAMAELEQRLLRLEEKQAELEPQSAKLSGYTVDSFRLAPIAKTILEFYRGNSEEPCYKLATNNQGYFSINEIAPGTYDIKVRHPRYLPLVMKSYVIANGENKSQDFLLKKV